MSTLCLRGVPQFPSVDMGILGGVARHDGFWNWAICLGCHPSDDYFSWAWSPGLAALILKTMGLAAGLEGPWDMEQS
jgi:hypothetical protein